MVQMPGNGHCTRSDLVVVDTEKTGRRMLPTFLDLTGSRRLYPLFLSTSPSWSEAFGETVFL